MIFTGKGSINPKKPLNQFIYGSVLLLFVGMFVAAFVFSETYLQKEQARETDSAQLIVRFFDSQRRGITDEMFTRRYDAIHLRIEGIAEQLGHADYEMTLVDENEHCVFHAVGSKVDDSGECKTPSSLKAMIPSFGAEVIHPSLQFDFQSERYIYMAPLRVGPLLKGYLYVTLSDPYEFYKENTLILVMKFFSIPITAILVGFLFWLFIAHRLILRPYLKKLVEMEKSEAVAKLAKKVAHNIQSPLVVTKSVARNMRGGDETQRRLLISAISRIDKISSHLISQFAPQGAISDSESYTFLWPILDSVVAEKIELLGTQSDIHLSYHLADELHSAGMAIPAEEVAAVISNLLNNAIESFEGYSTDRKQIVVSAVSLSGDRVRLEVADTGKGIPPSILAKLKQETCTFGKANGLGVGISDAKEVLLKAGGSISIESNLEKGTTVRLEIPLAGLPTWFLKTLNLSLAKHVVVLDDDPSVHLLWQQRLGSFPATYITDPEKLNFENFSPDSTFYILDYEIVGSKITGLDLLTKYHLGSNAALVTSHFNEPAIQKAILDQGAMMLPKFMINRVSIEFGESHDVNRPRTYDLILIDDDVTLHDLWHFEASQQGKRIRTVRSMNELDLNEYDSEVPIFVDKNLGEDVSGLQVALELNEAGFKNISLTTGERIDKASVPDFIKNVRDKNFPEMLVRA